MTKNKAPGSPNRMPYTPGSGKTVPIPNYRPGTSRAVPMPYFPGGRPPGSTGSAGGPFGIDARDVFQKALDSGSSSEWMGPANRKR